MTDPVKRAEELLAVGDACIRCGLPEDKVLWCTSLHSITVGNLLAIRELIARDKEREAEVKALREENKVYTEADPNKSDWCPVCKTGWGAYAKEKMLRQQRDAEITSLRGVVEKVRKGAAWEISTGGNHDGKCKSVVNFGLCNCKPANWREAILSLLPEVT